MVQPVDCPKGGTHDVIHGCEIVAERSPASPAGGARDDDWGDRQHHYLYRAGQLLVSRADEQLVRQRLEELEVGVLDEDGSTDNRSRRCLDALGFTRIRVDEANLAVPQIVTAVDRRDGPRVRPNHVLVSAFHFHVGPATPPREAGPEEFDSVPAPSEAAGLEDPTRVLVLDTGLVDDRMVRDQILQNRCSGDPEMIGTGTLPLNAGHGTFIAGLICKHTDNTTVEVRDVVDECGFVDDVALAARLQDVPEGVDILNLSFGGHGFDGEMVATVAQLKALTFRNPELVIVAAAGNDGNDTPILPAALPNVIGVAAVQRDGEGGWSRACFSNYGPWVDACAEGVDVASAFVNFEGELAPNVPPSPCQAVQDASTVAASGPPGPRTFAGRARWSGTSFAAPLVTAAIAQQMTDMKRSAKQAAFDLLFDPALESRRLPGLGILVEPQDI